MEKLIIDYVLSTSKSFIYSYVYICVFKEALEGYAAVGREGEIEVSSHSHSLFCFQNFLQQSGIKYVISK